MGSLNIFFSETEESVKKLKDEMTEEYLNVMTGLANEESMNNEELNITMCESPVERMLYLALNHQLYMMNGHLLHNLNVQKEFKFGTRKYRTDFLLNIAEPNYKESVEFVIEVDGHNFHEKTKQQVAKDKKRDREILRKVDGIIRFSGSEVYNSPLEKADEVLSIMKGKLYKKIRDKGGY